ncbi:MAG: radical SAM protein [Chloroflexi bacterium]|nr:radical SAM protein [Chloroflexota bacterium]
MTSTTRVGSHPGAVALNYRAAPVVAFWEITKACALACRHCRAQAQPKRHPLELTTRECFAVVEELGRFQPKPILVISGGDPLMRRDLFEVAGCAVDHGLRTSLSPSVTALVTATNLGRAYRAGVRHISFSLDGATPQVHDGFRGVAGSFDRTLESIAMAQEAGLTVQLNTTVSRWNLAQLPELAEIMARTGVILWDLFFLVPTGRASAQEMLSPQEHEEVFNWLYDLSLRASFPLKTTLGQHYRRVTLQRSGGDLERIDSLPSSNDGNGICFISHIGEVYPSGFLPVPCGNVRNVSLVATYREHPVFLSLRDKGQLKGKCGVCPFNAACGGCRARAYGLTGDYLAADPTCAFVPPAWKG